MISKYTSRMNHRSKVLLCQKLRKFTTSTSSKSVGTTVDNTKHKNDELFERVKAFFSETSGENEIYALKQKVNEVSQRFDFATRTVANARSQARTLQDQYEDLQKEHMNLMMRRENWSESDITKFAEVTSNEVKVKRALDEARTSLQKSEEEQEVRQLEYMDAVRMRYHEEQIWQDKWRVISTYGTWILIGLNSIIFIGGQVFHQMREQARIETLEDLLNEKLAEFSHKVDDLSHGEDESLDVCVDKVEIGRGKEVDSLPSQNDEAGNVDDESDSENEDRLREEIIFKNLTFKDKVLALCLKSKEILVSNFDEIHAPSVAFGAFMSGLIFISLHTRR